MKKLGLSILLLLLATWVAMAQVPSHRTTVQSAGGGQGSGGAYTHFGVGGQAGIANYATVGNFQSAAGFIYGQVSYTDRELDSMVLRSIYNYSNGSNWTRKENWLLNNAPINTWANTTVNANRVIVLDLSANNLADTLPATITRLGALSALDLRDNNLVKLPDFKGINLDVLDVRNNKLYFDDISPMIGKIQEFIYSPQKPFGTASTRTVTQGVATTLDFQVDLGPNVSYQWYKGEEPVAGATNAIYTFTPTGVAFAGAYTLRATSESVPGLTLTSAVITIQVSEISQDIDALRAFYTALGGANWTNRTNWNQNEDISTWFGVTLGEGLRVIGISLPNNNLVGTVPNDLLSIAQLSTLNISNNLITGVPNLTTLQNLSLVNISNNNLRFAQITPIVAVPGLVYQPQKPYGVADTITRLLSQSALFDTKVPLAETGNVYRWRLNGTAITDSLAGIQVFDKRNIELANAGLYTLAVTNPAAPLLTLVSNPILLNVINEYPLNTRDSLALVSIYNSLGGNSWTNRAGWLSDSVKKWQGVTLVRGNVGVLNLPNNNVKGNFPNLATDQLNNLELLNLSGNEGIVLPTSLASMTGLKTLNLANMKLARIPNATGLGQLTSLAVGNNGLQFADIQPFIGTPTFTYTPQDSLGTKEARIIQEGQNVNISYTIRGTNLTYQWRKDGQLMAQETNAAFLRPSYNVNDNGTYHLAIRHPQLPALTIFTREVALTMANSRADSLALVKIYNNMNGFNWPKKANWLTGNVSTWEGVTYEKGKVRGLNLASNNLTGALPAMSGFELSELTTLNLSGNNIESIPSLDGLTKLTSVNVSNNFLQFGALEAQGSLAKFTYSPQKALLARADVIRELGTRVVLSRVVSGSANSYSWTKGGEPFGTGAELVFEQVAFADEGDYAFTVTNANVPGLVLSVAPLSLFVASLERDIRMLQMLFDSTGGSGWSVAANWRQNPIAQPEIGLNANGLRVVSINLAGKGLTGKVPAELRTMSDLVNVNLGNNQLTYIPRLTGIVGLEVLNVGNNRLQFDGLQNNVGIRTYNFSPQAPITANALVRRPQGTVAQLNGTAKGDDLTYQWLFKNVVIPGANQAVLTIDSLRYEDMGEYNCLIFSARVAGFSLRTGIFTLQATANIAGNLRNLNNQLVQRGEAVLWKITPIGTPYIPVDTVVVTNSAFAFNAAILDDYVIRVVPESEPYIPTYHLSDVTFDAADTIRLRRNIASRDVILQIEPDELLPNPANTGKVNGQLEIETDNFPQIFDPNAGGRSEARRRVADVGVAFNRLRAINRAEDDRVFELIAYRTTDANGEFSIENLPVGTYRINFDFPGIPTDPSSFVEFDLGSGGQVRDNQVKLAAEITPVGIVVSKVAETGVRVPLLEGISYFPVPISNELTVKFSMARAIEGPFLVQVVDLSGKVVIEMVHHPRLGNNLIQLPFTTVKPGLYLVLINDKDGTHLQSVKVWKE